MLTQVQDQPEVTGDSDTAIAIKTLLQTIKSLKDGFGDLNIEPTAQLLGAAVKNYLIDGQKANFDKVVSLIEQGGLSLSSYNALVALLCSDGDARMVTVDETLELFVYGYDHDTRALDYYSLYRDRERSGRDRSRTRGRHSRESGRWRDDRDDRRRSPSADYLSGTYSRGDDE